MKKEVCRSLWAAIGFFVAFLLWTLAVRLVDVRAIGPLGSKVGFASLNQCVHEFTGVNMSLYSVTDWLGLIPIGSATVFAFLGVMQWIKRKSIFKVDYDILALGVFYVAVMAVFAFFEVFVVNYRPVLIHGTLEASYPSSTTLMVTCVMPAAILFFRSRINNAALRRCISLPTLAFTFFMVIVRLLSGVHWLTDIIGGVLLSAGLVLMYDFALRWNEKSKETPCSSGKKKREPERESFR